MREKAEHSFHRKVEDAPADPTAFSVRPDSVDGLHRVGKNERGRTIFEDIHGRRYHDIGLDETQQMFFSRLLKGILPVSDVIYDRELKRFLSHEMSLESVEPNRHLSYPATWILYEIFGDWDHGPETNTAIRGDSYALYDFEYAKPSISASEEVEALFRERILRHASVTPVEHHQNLDNMLQALIARLDGQRGHEFIAAIIKNMQTSGAGLPALFKGHETEIDVGIDKFQQVILARLAAARAGLAIHA